MDTKKISLKEGGLLEERTTNRIIEDGARGTGLLEETTGSAGLLEETTGNAGLLEETVFHVNKTYCPMCGTMYPSYNTAFCPQCRHPRKVKKTW